MTATAHWRLILNGKSADNADLRAAVAVLRAEGVRLDVRVTWEAGDVGRYVDEAIDDGVGTLVAAGGDGTLSGVATALAGRQASADQLPSLGLVPMGTANDFAAGAAIPDAPLDALRLIRTVPPVAVDLLRIRAGGDDHWVANLASGGFGTEVTVNTHETLKSMLGGLAYVISGLGALGRIEPQRARLSGPGFEWAGDFIVLAIGNGRVAGGGQVLCPDALIDDGQLEVTIVPPLDGELAATLGTAVLEGREAALERVALRRRLPWLEIDATVPLTLNLDGEPIQARNVRIDCVAARVRMHLPADCPLLTKTATVRA